MIKNVLLGFAGIILFLYGMTSLSLIMQRLFTVRIRNYIRLMVRDRLTGFLTGIVTTILFQSSSATTVLIVGLVSAGLVNFYSSLAVILGADIGTTITVQLIAWRIGDISPLFLIVGGIGWFLGEGKKKRASGAVFAFGLMFFGLYVVSLAAQPLKTDPHIMELFRSPVSPLFAFLFGVLFTALVHASAIPIGMLVLLSNDGLVSLHQALPILIGANVGTATTAIIAAFVSTPPGRRTAAAHFFFKLMGAVVMLPMASYLAAFLDGLSTNPGQKVVLAHLFFNLAIALGFIFITSPVACMWEKLLPGKERFIPLWPEHITHGALKNPEEALEAARKEIVRQGEIAQRMFELAAKSTVTFFPSYMKDIQYLELAQNNLREEIVSYLRLASAQELSSTLAQRIFSYTATSDDIERMCNHMVSLVVLSQEKASRHIAFTSYAMAELEGLKGYVATNLSESITLIRGTGEREKLVKAISFREERIDLMVKEARNNHLVRFHKRLCQPEAGPIFLEMLIHFERISDHCQNIADYWGEFTA